MKFFWVPVRDSEGAGAELNRFLSQHQVAHVERNFLSRGTAAGWAICIEYVEESGGSAKSSATVDYRAILDPESFRIFSALRKWRKEEAAKHGVPVYAVASNEQLATAARERIDSPGRLREVEGFGEGKVSKHGEALLAALKKSIGAESGEGSSS